jgi:hypothetical protein
MVAVFGLRAACDSCWDPNVGVVADVGQRGLRRFAILAAYLLAFYLVMHYYFGF